MPAIKLSDLVGCSLSQFKRAIHYRLTQPTLDMTDSVYTLASPLAVTANDTIRLTFSEDSLLRNFKNGLNTNTGISKLYNFTDNTTDWSEFEDTPTIVLFPNVLFKPASANEGKCIINCYVNESAPILHDQAIVDYKGTVYEKMGDLFSVYAGAESGYDVKNKGVYFTFSFSHDGLLYSKSLLQYLT